MCNDRNRLVSKIRWNHSFMDLWNGILPRLIASKPLLSKACGDQYPVHQQSLRTENTDRWQWKFLDKLHKKNLALKVVRNKVLCEYNTFCTFIFERFKNFLVIIMYLRGRVLTMTMILLTSRSAVENVHHVHSDASQTRYETYTINCVITTIWYCNTPISIPVFLQSTEWRSYYVHLYSLIST